MWTDPGATGSRRRILDALAHREPDRVPIDLGATPSSGISAVAYGRLLPHLGLAGLPNRVYDVVQELSEPDPPVLERFGVDVLDIGRAFNADPSAWTPLELIPGTPALYPAWFRPGPVPGGGWEVVRPDGLRIARMPPGATFFDQAVFPWVDGYPDKYAGLDEAMDQVLWSALVHSPWDRAGEEGFWDRLRAHALDLRRTTDKALVIVCGCNLFEWGTFLRRLDNFLMDLVLEPERVEGLLDALMERHLAFLDRVCRAVGDVADILRFGDDLGMDQGPLLSPEDYRRFFKPRHARLCDFVRRHSRMHTFLHSCGSIHALVPDLIEAGFEILNPVQTSARCMEPERLKRDFGRDVTFWGGGCDTRRVLNRGTPEEVRDHVRRNLEILSPGGGFVFSAVHNILSDVPPENIVAMMGTVLET